MQIPNRTLLALALGALLVTPGFAGEQKGKKPTETVQASDSVSQRTTARESGRMMESPLKHGTINPGKGNWWADADIDGDGKLSLGEAKAQAGLEARFSTVDGDADGFVTNDEYRKFFTTTASQGEVHASAHSAVVTRDTWMRLDGNKDGKLSSSEVSTDTGISGAFSGMDGNGDGFVTQAEYSTYAKANLK